MAGELTQEMELKCRLFLRPRGMFFSFTPKALRLNELRAEGKSFDEALSIADSEYTADGLLLRRGVTDLDAVLSRGMAQMGEVQF